jgi:maltodextrin utilization protein YvdJ
LVEALQVGKDSQATIQTDKKVQRVKTAKDHLLSDNRRAMKLMQLERQHGVVDDINRDWFQASNQRRVSLLFVKILPP